MMIPDKLINEYIEKWKDAGVTELKARLRNLPKRTVKEVVAERKAIEALLS